MLAYTKFTPFIDVGFWKELARRKLEDWKLDDSSKTIYGKYQVTKFKDPQLKLNFDVYSFETPSFPAQGPLEVILRGKIKLFNVWEDFQATDMSLLLKEFKDSNEEA